MFAGWWTAILNLLGMGAGAPAAVVPDPQIVDLIAHSAPMTDLIATDSSVVALTAEAPQ